MRTRCPNCDTLYRIDQDELASAEGQVRCYRCESVFDAYRHRLTDEEGLADELLDITPEPDIEDDLSALTDPLDSELDLGTPTDTEDEAESELNLIELADSLRGNKAKPELHDELDLDDLDLGGSETQPESELSPDEQAALDRDLAPPTVSSSRNGRHPATVVGQLLLILLLGLGTVAQFAWHQREQLLQDPDAHELAANFCRLAGCRLPLLHAPEAYQVVQRQLRPASQNHEALSLQLSFRNRAAFPQALPDLQLSLFDREERLIARRRLTPDEYLFPASTENLAVAAEEVVTIELLFEDPGSYASGFKLEFL